VTFLGASGAPGVTTFLVSPMFFGRFAQNPTKSSSKSNKLSVMKDFEAKGRPQNKRHSSNHLRTNK